MTINESLLWSRLSASRSIARMCVPGIDQLDDSELFELYKHAYVILDANAQDPITNFWKVFIDLCLYAKGISILSA